MNFVLVHIHHQHFSGWHVSQANIDSCVTPCQLMLLTQRLIDNWKRALMGSVNGSHLFHFALCNALLLPSPVNSSTLHELGAEEYLWDERDRGLERERWVGELDWAALSSVDLLHWSCPSTLTLVHTYTHACGYACPEKCSHMHTYTLTKILRSSLESLVKALKQSWQQSPTAL